MKTNILCSIAFFSCLCAYAETTIDPANQNAYGANLGWINAAANTTHGAVIGQSFCSGYLYSANVGWIHLGDGSPLNGHSYASNYAIDYGVNHDGSGNLSGFAYGANIGWITFEQAQGKPQIDLSTGQLSGYAWGANVGWINLSTLATLTIDPGHSNDGDSIPDAWEYSHVTFGRNALKVLTETGDKDGDGISDKDEYLADTDPFDENDYLRITDFESGASSDNITWPVKASRSYTLQQVGHLEPTTAWAPAKATFTPGADYDHQASVPKSSTNRFYRVQAAPPLSP